MAQRNTEGVFKPLSKREKELTKEIIDIAFLIHMSFGPGLLESIYEKCFCHELKNRNIPYRRQECVQIIFKGLIIDEGLRIDIMVEDLIIIELKAQEVPHPEWEAQLLSYLKLT